MSGGSGCSWAIVQAPGVDLTGTEVVVWLILCGRNVVVISGPEGLLRAKNIIGVTLNGPAMIMC